MASNANIGSLIYDIEIRTGKAKAATKVVGAEFNQVKREALALGTNLDKTQAQFGRFAAKGRELGPAMDLAAVGVGKLAAKGREHKDAVNEGIKSMKEEREVLRITERFKGKLTDAERGRLQTLNNQIPAFERQVKVQRDLAAVELRKVAQTKRNARDDKAAKDQVVANSRKSLANEKAMISERQAKWDYFYRNFKAKQAEAAAKEKAHLADRARANKANLANEKAMISERQAKWDYFYRNFKAKQAEAAAKEKAHLADRARANKAYFAKQREMQAKRFADDKKNTALLGTNLKGLIKQIGFITIAYKSLMFAQRSLTKALELGREQMQFEIFTGSADIAERLVGELRQIAATTPLILSSTMQATRTMLQYGVASRDVIKRLRQLGDVSGGSHERLQRLALAMGQITANGRLQGQELRQLVESGFNPLSVISEETGESMLSLRDKMADGLISVDMVADALEKATSEGGRFANAMDRVAKETAFGKIQVLLGQIEVAAVDVAKEWAREFGDIASALSKFVAELNKVRRWWSEARSVATKEEQAILDLRSDQMPAEIWWDLNRQKLYKESLISELRIRKAILDAAKKEKQEKEDEDKAAELAENARLERFDKILQAIRTERKELKMTDDQKAIARARTGGATEVEISRLKQLQELRADEKDFLKDQEDKAAAAADLQRKTLDIAIARADTEKKRMEVLGTIVQLERKGALTAAQALAARDKVDRQKEKRAEFIRKEDQKLTDRLNRQRDMLDIFSGIKSELIEIAELEKIPGLFGGLSEDEANARRKQLRKEMAKIGKDTKSASGQAFSAQSGSREEYKLLRAIAMNKQKDAEEKRQRKEEEKHWKKMEKFAEDTANGIANLEPAEALPN